MIYYVVVCPDKYCRGISILNKKIKTPSCRKCNKSYNWEKFKISYETEVHTDAIMARTELLTKQSDNGPSFDEIKESGGLEDADRAYPEKDNKNDNRSSKEIILDIIDELDEPTIENIIKKSISNEINEDKARKIVDKVLYEGYAIKNNGQLKLI